MSYELSNETWDSVARSAETERVHRPPQPPNHSASPETRRSGRYDLTRLLLQWTDGDPRALSELMPLVVDDLRRMARRYLHREPEGHTLQPTALVNEFFLRIYNRRAVNWRNRAHFFGFAAQTMRLILVDHARRQHRAKRGDGIKPVPLDQAIDVIHQPNMDLLALEEALNSLAKIDHRQAKIVELRFFIGLTIEEIGKILGISDRTVKRDWQLARLWLYRELKDTCPRQKETP